MMTSVCLPGLSEPTLQLNKGVVSEGEEITASCSAPGETGSIFFYFYDNSNDVAEKHESSNQTKVKFHLSSVGIHKIHCRYSVLLTPGSQDSEVSNSVTVSVKGTSASSPVLLTSPRSAQLVFSVPQSCQSCRFWRLLLTTRSLKEILSQ